MEFHPIFIHDALVYIVPHLNSNALGRLAQVCKTLYDLLMKNPTRPMRIAIEKTMVREKFIALCRLAGTSVGPVRVDAPFSGPSGQLAWRTFSIIGGGIGGGGTGCVIYDEGCVVRDSPSWSFVGQRAFKSPRPSFVAAASICCGKGARLRVFREPLKIAGVLKSTPSRTKALAKKLLVPIEDNEMNKKKKRGILVRCYTTWELWNKHVTFEDVKRMWSLAEDKSRAIPS
jgi:hypothetical protein